MKKWQEAMLSLPTQPPGIPAADTPSPTVIAVMAKRQCATCEPVVKVSGALRERRYWRTVSDAAVLNADSMVELQRAALSTADAPRPAARGGVDAKPVAWAWQSTALEETDTHFRAKREYLPACVTRDGLEFPVYAHPPAVRVLDGWYLVEHNRHVYEQLDEASARQAFADLAAKDPSIPERMAVTRLALLDAAPDESVCEECGGRGGYEVSLDPPMSLPCACTLGAAPDAGTGEGATGKAALQVDDAAVGSVVVDEAMAGMATGKAGSLRETQPEIHETLVQTVHAYMEVARIGVQQNKYGDTFLRRHTSALKTARSVQDALEALILALAPAAQPTEGAGDASL